jgi:Flp pilus assembly pilin Flp
MNFKKFLKSREGQSVIEYCLVMAIIVAAIFSSNFLLKTRVAFTGHFASLVTSMLE